MNRNNVHGYSASTSKRTCTTRDNCLEQLRLIEQHQQDLTEKLGAKLMELTNSETPRKSFSLGVPKILCTQNKTTVDKERYDWLQIEYKKCLTKLVDQEKLEEENRKFITELSDKEFQLGRLKNTLENKKADIKRLEKRIADAKSSCKQMQEYFSNMKETEEEELKEEAENIKERLENMDRKYLKIIMKKKFIIDELKVLAKRNQIKWVQEIEKIVNEIECLVDNFKVQKEEIYKMYANEEQRKIKMQEFLQSAEARQRIITETVVNFTREAKLRNEKFINELD